MNKEAKQYIRNQIDSCVKTQSNYNEHIYYLHYNKSYIRALKFSTITNKPVNKEDFKGGEPLFGFNTKHKEIWSFYSIEEDLKENYSINYSERQQIIKEVINEYEEYKDYKIC